jgi:hypothetical protein
VPTRRAWCSAAGNGLPGHGLAGGNADCLAKPELSCSGFRRAWSGAANPFAARHGRPTLGPSAQIGALVLAIGRPPQDSEAAAGPSKQ